MATVADLQVKFSADTAGAEAGTKRVQGLIGNLTSGVKGLATVAGGFVLGTAINNVVGGIGRLANAGLDFEANMANVNSIAQLSTSELNKLSQSVIGIAGDPRILAGPAELAAGLYDVQGSGFAAQDALTIVQQAALAATAGLTTTDTASRAITAALNAYGYGADQAQRISDVFFRTVDSGVISFEQLANNLGNTLPLASTLGVSVEQLGAAYAQLTINGVQASQAETQIAALMRSAVKPTEALKNAVMEKTGATVQDMLATEGLGGFLQFLTETTGGSTEALGELLGTQEAINAALILGKNNGEDYVDLLEDMEGATEGAGATAQALEKQMKSSRFAIQEARKQVEILATITMGMLSPAISAAARGFSSLISGAIIPFINRIQDLMDSGLNPLAAIFTTIGGILDNLGLDALVPVFDELALFAARLGAAMADVVDAFQDLVRGDVNGFFRELREAADTAWSAVQTLASNLGTLFEEAITWTIDTGIPEIIGWLDENRGAIWEGIKSLVNWTTNTFSEVISWTADVGIPKVIGTIHSIAGRASDWLKGLLIGGIQGDGTGGPFPAGGSISSIIEAWSLQVGIPKIIGTITSIAGRLGDWLRGYIYSGSAGGGGLRPGMIDPGGIPGGGGITVEIAEVILNVLDATVEGLSQDRVNQFIQTSIDEAQRYQAEIKEWDLWIRGDAEVQGVEKSRIEQNVEDEIIRFGPLEIDPNSNIVFSTVNAVLSYEIDPVKIARGFREFMQSGDKLGILEAELPSWTLGIPEPTRIKIQNSDWRGIIEDAIPANIEAHLDFWRLVLGTPIPQAIEGSRIAAEVEKVLPDGLEVGWRKAWDLIFHTGPQVTIPNPHDIPDLIRDKLPDIEVDLPKWDLSIPDPDLKFWDTLKNIPGRIRDVLPDFDVDLPSWNLDIDIPDFDMPSGSEFADAIKAALPSIPSIDLPVSFNIIPDFGGGDEDGSSGGGGGGSRGHGIARIPQRSDFARLIEEIQGAGGRGGGSFALPPVDTSAFIASLQNAATQTQVQTTAILTRLQSLAAPAGAAAQNAGTQFLTNWRTNLVNAATQTQVNLAAMQSRLQAFVGPAGAAGQNAGTQFQTNWSNQLRNASTQTNVNITAIQSRLQSLVGPAGAAGTSAGSGFRSGLVGALQSAAGSVAGIIGQIRSTLSSASSGAFGYGAAVGNQFAAGLRSTLGAISAAAAAIRALLPSSPAKKGPLSKPISFAYITQDLERNAALWGGLVERGLREAGRGIDRYGPLQVGGVGMAGSGPRGNAPVVVNNHYHYHVLPREMLRIMEGSDMGRAAYAGIGARAREINLGPGRGR